MSRRREGVDGLEGVLYANIRFREGVDGKADVDAVGCRVGELGRCGESGSTSACRIEVKSEFACSTESMSVFEGMKPLNF